MFCIFWQKKSDVIAYLSEIYKIQDGRQKCQKYDFFLITFFWKKIIITLKKKKNQLTLRDIHAEIRENQIRFEKVTAPYFLGKN